MHARRLFYTQACLITAISALHIIALDRNLYWHFVWLDLPVHFLAAAWVALFTVWLCAAIAHAPRWWNIVGTVVVVGIGWEMFELWGGVPREANFALDTMLDLLMDTLGGISGLFLAFKLVTHDTIASHGAEAHSS